MRTSTCPPSGFWIGLRISLVLLFTTQAVMAESAPGDLVLPRVAESMSAEAMLPSVFQHWVHRVNFRCDACHTRLFKMKLGATPITMEMMGDGKSCGVCHNGNVAFAVSLDSCNRCHRAPDE